MKACIFTDTVLAMLKFWKKKPPDETPPAAPGDEKRADVSDEAPPAAAAALEHAANPIEPEAAPIPKRSWRERLSGSGFARGLSSVFARNPVLDDALLDDLETCLISADVGVGTAAELVERLRSRVARREFADAERTADGAPC